MNPSYNATRCYVAIAVNVAGVIVLQPVAVWLLDTRLLVLLTKSLVSLTKIVHCNHTWQCLLFTSGHFQTNLKHIPCGLQSLKKCWTLEREIQYPKPIKIIKIRVLGASWSCFRSIAIEMLMSGSRALRIVQPLMQAQDQSTMDLY